MADWHNKHEGPLHALDWNLSFYIDHSHFDSHTHGRSILKRILKGRYRIYVSNIFIKLFHLLLALFLYYKMLFAILLNLPWDFVIISSSLISSTESRSRICKVTYSACISLPHITVYTLLSFPGPLKVPQSSFIVIFPLKSFPTNEVPARISRWRNASESSRLRLEIIIPIILVVFGRCHWIQGMFSFFDLNNNPSVSDHNPSIAFLGPHLSAVSSANDEDIASPVSKMWAFINQNKLS